jgi:transposase InsO family protein
MVSPARRRDAVAYLCRRRKVSERRACKVVGQHRSTQRYTAAAGDFELRLVAAMNKMAERYPRYGYRKVHALLVTDGWAVNRKRIERLWRLEGHRVPPTKAKHSGKKSFGDGENSAWNLPAVHPDHVWSYDFVTARTADGGPLRVLNIVDEFTRECVSAHVARNIGAREVQRVLERAFASRGRPRIIRSDNGREFIADTLVSWLKDQGVRPAFIAKASPQQNCYVERFNGTMRRELLDGELLHSVTEARVVIGDWVELYNHIRPHRGLRMRTPARFASEQRALSTTKDPSKGRK